MFLMKIACNVLERIFEDLIDGMCLAFLILFYSLVLLKRISFQVLEYLVGVSCQVAFVILAFFLTKVTYENPERMMNVLKFGLEKAVEFIST